MRISITSAPDGELVIRACKETVQADIQIDVEPNATDENQHLYVTIEHDGQTFEGRLPGHNADNPPIYMLSERDFESLAALVEYNYHDEKKHYDDWDGEDDTRKGHIFNHIRRLKNLVARKEKLRQ